MLSEECGLTPFLRERGIDLNDPSAPGEIIEN